MKIKESPSIILAFHGMLGRKKQTGLLLLLLTLVFSFLTAAVIYSVSSAQVLQDTRCDYTARGSTCVCRILLRTLHRHKTPCPHPHRSAQ